MANIWITSDLHFGHKRIMDFCSSARQWASVKEMNEGLVEAWNNTVKNGDTIYFLGDFSFMKREETEKVLKQLNGYVYLVYGNHDQQLRERWAKNYFMHRADIMHHKILGEDVVMCHYPLLRWEKAHYGSLHCFGHEHGNLEGVGRSMDVGWDANQGKILNMEDVVSFLKQKEILKHHGKVGEQHD